MSEPMILTMLRPYQEAFVHDILASLRLQDDERCPWSPVWPAGEAHPCSVVGQVATGGGKTHSAGELVRLALAGALPGVHTVAFWADLREITSDTVDRFRAAGLQVGVHAAGHASTAEPVQVVQVQTATRRLKAGTNPPAADLLILDEAHICEAVDLAAALRAAAPRYLVGLTATPSRGDGKGLGRTFTRLVQGPQTGALQADGYLVPCEVICPARGYLPRGLAMHPAEAVARHALPGDKRRVLVFCADGEARPTAAACAAAGYSAEVLAAETHPKVRATQRARLAGGELQVLCTVDCAVKGWDCPAVDTVVLARGVSVPGVYLQMIGRALRPSPGKERATIIDLRGNVWLHGLPEEPRRWSLGDEAVVQQATGAFAALQACRGCAWLGPAQGPFRPCPRCGANLGAAIKPQVVLKAEKMAKLAKLTPADRRKAVERSTRAALSRNAWKVPRHARDLWVNKKVEAAMAAYDAKQAAQSVEEGA